MGLPSVGTARMAMSGRPHLVPLCSPRSSGRLVEAPTALAVTAAAAVDPVALRT